MPLNNCSKIESKEFTENAQFFPIVAIALIATVPIS